MKIDLTRTVVGVCLLSSAMTAALAEAPVFVNMEAIFQGYYKTARKDSAFKKQKDVYNERAKDVASELEGLKEQHKKEQEDALNIALSDAVREQKQAQADETKRIIQQKDAELRKFFQDVDKDLQKKYLEYRAEIVEEITDFIREYSEKKDYDLVLDISGLTRNFIPVVVYSPKEKDITDEVLAQLNKGHEDEIPDPDETSEEESPDLELEK